MISLLIAIITQILPFLPLTLAIYISFYILKATDMTLDGSFVLGGGVFARLIELGINPYLAGISALLVGSLAGMGVATMQRGQKIDPLLAGVLATFMLTSFNLILMHRPNISLLSKTTLVSAAFAKGEFLGWIEIALYVALFCGIASVILFSRAGLLLRAFGENPDLLKRLGKNIESYRLFGFALTNILASASGLLTAQTIGYADISMGMGVTLTALGTVILGKQLLGTRIFSVSAELIACLAGVALYFLVFNGLLRLSIDPIYLKIILGGILIFALRAASRRGV